MFCRPASSALVPLMSLIAALVLISPQAWASKDAPQPIYFNLPEVTTAINPTQQVVALVSLRLAGPKTEQRARERMVRLRHAFVLQLADLDPAKLDAASLENLAEAYREEADRILSASATNSRRVVLSVLLQKFVVQSK